MLFSERGLHPMYWGVDKSQLATFGDEVRAAMAQGKIRNQPDRTKDFYYPQERFDDPAIGPNMHQVNNGLIKPLTKQHPELPSLSYAVMRNLKRGGLRCSLFYSHAWNEGVFEFICHALATWPDECEGAYICFLANPQNLNIGALVGGGVGSSPFYRVLCSEPPPRMIMR